MLEPYTDLLTGEEISVNEILEMYNIKGLTLPELQEKYVNDQIEYYEKLSDLEEKNEELNSNIKELQEEISELTTTIEELEYNVNFNKYIPTNNSGSFVFSIVILVIALVYVISNKKE